MSKSKYIRPLGKKVIRFIGLVLLIHSILYFAYEFFGERNSKLFKNDLRLDTHRSSIDFLFMGHSRPGHAINDSLIPNAFNFASNGESNIYTYYKLKYLLEQTDKDINYIVFPIGHASFFDQKNPYIVNHNYWNKYIDYTELGAAKSERFKYIQVNAQSTFTPYAHWINQVLNRKFPKLSHKKGGLHLLANNEKKQAHAYTIIKNNLESRNYFSDISLSYFKRTIALCEKHNKKVILIRYPITSYYKEASETLISQQGLNHKGLNTILSSLEKVTIWDFENLYFGRDELFKDAHHMNAAGRLEFSEFLKTRLENFTN